MCELLGMSARLPASITLSLNEFARHGGETGPHADGWGIAFYDGRDVNLIRESAAAARSELMSTLRHQTVTSEIVIAHIRQASQGPVSLCNTHPFRRELAGRVHVFAHNGHWPRLKAQSSFNFNRSLSPIGETDSEYAFCILMQRISELWLHSDAAPALSERIEVISAFAREMSAFGPANFLYSDGDALFVHADVRTQANGQRAAPALHFTSVACNYGMGFSELTNVEFQSERTQQVTLVSTLPLRERGWRPMSQGQLLVAQGGKVVYGETVSGDKTTGRLSRFPRSGGGRCFHRPRDRVAAAPTGRI